MARTWLNAAMVVAILASALAVSYSVHEGRRLTNQLQKLQASHDALHTEWGQLLLEHSTWGSYARVEQLARQKLSMQLPTAAQRVLVTP